MNEGELRNQALEVRQLATELVAKADALLAVMDSEGIAVPGQGTWTRARLEQIRRDVESNSGLKTMFELLSRCPQDWMTYSQVLDATGKTDRDMRSDLRSLSRLTTKLLGAKSWPFEASQGPRAASGRWEMTYRMDPVIADWWESAE